MKASLPKRKRNRLPGFSYSRQGSYFITICTYKHKAIFGEVLNGRMVPSAIGDIVNKTIHQIPEKHSHVSCGIYQLMPNHLHIILEVNGVGANLSVGPEVRKSIKTRRHPGRPLRNNETIPHVVRWLKTASTNKIINEVKAGNVPTMITSFATKNPTE